MYIVPNANGLPGTQNTNDTAVCEQPLVQIDQALMRPFRIATLGGARVGAASFVVQSHGWENIIPGQGLATSLHRYRGSCDYKSQHLVEVVMTAIPDYLRSFYGPSSSQSMRLSMAFYTYRQGQPESAKVVDDGGEWPLDLREQQSLRDTIRKVGVRHACAFPESY